MLHGTRTSWRSLAGKTSSLFSAQPVRVMCVELNLHTPPLVRAHRACLPYVVRGERACALHWVMGSLQLIHSPSMITVGKSSVTPKPCCFGRAETVSSLLHTQSLCALPNRYAPTVSSQRRHLNRFRIERNALFMYSTSCFLHVMNYDFSFNVADA